MANLGLQNKNPGNLKDPNTGSFRVFNTPEEGYQALLQDIEYKQSGKSQHIRPGATLFDLANVWAPASDNNVPINWANNVAKTIGVTIDTPFDKIPKDLLAKGIQAAEGTSTLSIMNTQNKTGLSYDAFAQKIKAKHPEYNDMSNEDLTQKILAKYPQYKDLVSPDIAKKASYTSPFGTDPNVSVAEQIKDNPITRAAEERQSGIFGDSTAGKVGNFLTASTQDLGKHLGTAFGAKGNIKDLNKSVDDFQITSTKMMDAIDQARKQGKDTSKLEAAFRLYNQSAPQSKDFVSPEMQKELEKGFWTTLGEVGGTALESFGAGKILSKGKGLLTDLVKNPLKAKEIAYNIPMEMKDFLKLKPTTQYRLLEDVVGKIDGKDLFKVLQAMESLSSKLPSTLKASPSFLSRLGKFGLQIGSYEALKTIFGNKVGSFIHKVSGL